MVRHVEGKKACPSPQTAKIISDFVYNRTNDVTEFLSVTFPPEWINTHPNYLETIPSSSEIVNSNILVQQFNAVENWLARNWSGACTELSKISRPVLIITGTEDVAVPAANSLMLVQNIPDAWLVQIRDAGHGLIYQYPDEFSRIISTFMNTTMALSSFRIIHKISLQ